MFANSLEELIAKDQISGRIKLYAHAVDRRKWDLLDHVFHDDGRWRMSAFDGPWREARDTVARIFEQALAMTFHQVSNISISLNGAEAFAETYCVGYHRVRADAPPGGLFGGTGEDYDLIAALRYIDRFELRASGWGITSRTGISEWRSYQPVSEGTALASAPDRGQWGDADRSAVLFGGRGMPDPLSSGA
ncbi:nuclear transport factor 2 family protein [Sphingobium chlorophenolicum]|uniref:SnoaL-like domain-containing protein n=1 Tax=Sphingobium chlorophenolicum TaxID=46429 RepID=A0A081RBZ8_SPHCR|nr:nuclear transport factor 2 family protein [Sphingobium chlorophenolicum]KEQ52721.1 hypothetical protein BV95_02994 [Sphingobium chlorophenolicum]